jgi:putative sterol carrier protein
MADQPAATENVTPEQFFNELLPAGFEEQKKQGNPVPQDFRIQYHLTGDGGGPWHVTINEGKLEAEADTKEAHITITVSIDDWRDALHSRNGAAPSLILPATRPGRPDNSARVKQVRGTLVQELAREGAEPFKIQLTFNGAESPKTTLKMKIADAVAMQEGRLNGQEAFMTGKVRIEGDMAFMMQIAAVTG